MVHRGIIACPDLSGAECAIKIIQAAVSILMLLLVLIVLISRLRKDPRFSFYLVISLFMALTLLFLTIDAFRAELRLFSHLADYSYSVYFSILVLKLGLKLLRIIRHKTNFKTLTKIIYTTFIIYQILLLTALAYSIATKDQECFILPFLLSNIISLIAAIVFVFIGVRHSQYQEQRIDLTMSDQQMRNPLPQFQGWVALNFVGEVMMLIQSVIFQLNDCQFAEDQTVNEVCRLLFQFLSFHLGIAATIYFFHLSNHAQESTQSEVRPRDSTFGDTPRGIEMVNLEFPGAPEEYNKEQDKSRSKTTAPTLDP